MKKALYLFAMIAVTSSCNSKQSKMEVFSNLDTARQYVEESFTKDVETLLISDELNDPMGMNMTIIGDGILKKGYMPDGFVQKDGYRIYKYIKEE